MIKIVFLCWISTAYAQSVSWTVGTTPITYNEDLKLDCTVSSGCCTSSDRIWVDGSGNQIMNNGNSASPNKYAEDWNITVNTGFSLIIKNLQLSDVDMEYDCQYSLGKDKHALTQDDTWEYPAVATETTEIKQVKNLTAQLTGTFYISRSAPLPSIIGSFGDENVTSDLTITGLSNFDNWFYNLTVSIDVVCRNGKRITLSVVTGTKTTIIFNGQRNCIYPEYGIRNLGYMVIGTGVVFIFVFCLIKIKFGYLWKDMQSLAVTAAVFVNVSFLLNHVIAGTVGIYAYYCGLLMILPGVGTGVVGIILAILTYKYVKFKTDAFARLLVLTIVEAIVIGVVDLIVVGHFFKGKCDICGGRATGWAVLASVCFALCVVLTLKFAKKLRWKKVLLYSCLIFGKSVVVDIVVAVPFAMYLCPCTGWKDPLFMLLGIVYSGILLFVFWPLFDQKEDPFPIAMLTFYGIGIGIIGSFIYKDSNENSLEGRR